MSKKSQVKIRLVITEFKCHPDDISKILNLKPTRIWLQGDLIPRTLLKRKQNGWHLDSPLLSRGDIEQQTNALLKLVLPQCSRFAKLPKGSEVELSCIVYDRGEPPPVYFSSKTIKMLAKLNAEIDVDYYQIAP